MAGRASWLPALVAGGAIACLASTATAAGLASKYPGPWLTDWHRGIAQALAAKRVRGCGEFRYRPHTASSGEFLVRCTADGRLWTTYLVWPSVGDVMGPYPPDPSLD